MNLIWQNEGVTISGVTTNRFQDAQLFVIGTGVLAQTVGVSNYAKQFQWEATATTQGWYITIHAINGKVGEVQGSTFNLPLEVAAAVRRLL